MNMPIYKLGGAPVHSSGQSSDSERTTQPGASPDLDRPYQSSSGLLGEHARHRHSRANRHRCPSKAAGEFPSRGAKQWGRARARGSSITMHVKPASCIAGEYAHMIEALRGSSSRSEPERFVKARSRLQASMFRSERRSTARLRAAAGRCMLLVRAGDSHYTNRHKGLRRSKQGV